MASSDASLKRQILQLLAGARGGKWTFDSFSSTTISLRNTEAVAPSTEAAAEACTGEILELCAVRAVLQAPAHAMRAQLQYRVPWADVQLAWKVLSDVPEIRPMVSTIGSTLCAV